MYPSLFLFPSFLYLPESFLHDVRERCQTTRSASPLPYTLSLSLSLRLHAPMLRRFLFNSFLVFSFSFPFSLHFIPLCHPHHSCCLFLPSLLPSFPSATSLFSSYTPSLIANSNHHCDPTHSLTPTLAHTNTNSSFEQQELKKKKKKKITSTRPHTRPTAIATLFYAANNINSSN